MNKDCIEPTNSDNTIDAPDNPFVLSARTTEFEHKPVYTYFVLIYTSTAPSSVKTSLELPFRRGIINVVIVKQFKPFTERRFKRYMHKYYPENKSMYQYCYDVSNELSSKIIELYRLIMIKLRAVLIHYQTTSERIHPIDSKHSFKTYDEINYLSTLNEVNTIVYETLCTNKAI
jgi:hypothetical protein